MVIEIVVGWVEYVQGRESYLFPKLDLPLLKAGFFFPFLFFIRMKQEWMSGIFLHHKSIPLLNISIQYCNHGFSAMFYTSSKLIGISTRNRYAYQIGQIACSVSLLFISKLSSKG